MYQRALAADPEHANNLGNYANFLTRPGGPRPGRADVPAGPGRRPRARQQPRQLRELPTNVRGDHDQAEQMYQRALAADPDHANNLGNYAIFLTTVRGDHDQAEQMYQRALAADPEHANNLGNYANFLTDRAGGPRPGRADVPAGPGRRPRARQQPRQLRELPRRPCGGSTTRPSRCTSGPWPPTPSTPTTSATTRSSWPTCGGTTTRPSRCTSGPWPPTPSTPTTSATTRTS